MWVAGKSRQEVLAAMRRQRHRRFMNRYGRYMAAGALTVAVAAVMLWAAVMLADGGSAGESEIWQQGREAQEVRIAISVSKVEVTAEPREVPIDEQYPFNTMSRDWEGEDVQGFKPYQIPREYERTGGVFPEVMQIYTYIVCGQAGVDYAVTLALIEVESGYKWDAGGVNDDVGYMQIVRKWHEDRMERLNAGDLQNPFQNVSVGVDFLAEMLEKYGGNYEKALTAYQYGASGAYQHFFSCGEERSPYAEEVLEVAERIKKEMGAE